MMVFTMGISPLKGAPVFKNMSNGQKVLYWALMHDNASLADGKLAPPVLGINQDEKKILNS